MIKLLPVIFALLFPQAIFAETYYGKVVHITDGDTIKVLVGNTPIKIRFAEIDAPESGQPFGNVAKQALGNLVFGKDVRVEQVDIDRYKRVVGEVYLEDVWVNAWLVQEGYAWVYPLYAKSPELYKLEQQARNMKKGLWNSTERTPPWEWRKKR